MDINPEEIPEEIHDAAVDWHLEFDGIEPTPPPERWEEFRNWLEADPQHRTAYQVFDYTVNRFLADCARFGWGKGPPQAS